MKRFISEFFGTAFLLMVVVGSGIMGDKLSGGNAAIALLANSLATGAGLFVIIECLGPLSGAHLNPVVSFIEYLWGNLKVRDLVGYCIAQISGATVGVGLTHIMFALPILEISQKNRVGLNFFVSEIVATFGLICIISLPGRKHVERVPVIIAAYITSAYWFTSSTSFANPAVTIARALTDTFCGIAPSGIPVFVVAQFLGGLAGYWVSKKCKT